MKFFIIFCLGLMGLNLSAFAGTRVLARANMISCATDSGVGAAEITYFVDPRGSRKLVHGKFNIWNEQLCFDTKGKYQPQKLTDIAFDLIFKGDVAMVTINSNHVITDIEVASTGFDNGAVVNAWSKQYDKKYKNFKKIKEADFLYIKESDDLVKSPERLEALKKAALGN